MSEKKVIPLIKDSYLSVIKNSIGSKTWRDFFAKVDGDKKNISNNGRLSCAFFVSTILIMFGLIKKGHMTVRGTIIDMQDSGWFEIRKPKIGCVLIWEKAKFNGDGLHQHVGFYIARNKAISNSYKLKTPIVHDYKFGNNHRQIEKLFWHESLGD